MIIEVAVNYLLCFCADFKKDSVFRLKYPGWLIVEPPKVEFSTSLVKTETY